MGELCDLHWAGHGKLIPRLGSLGTLLQCLSPLPYTHSQLTRVFHWWVTWVGQEIDRDAQHPPKATLASRACTRISFMSPCSWKRPSDGQHPQFFSSHHSKFQLTPPTHPCTSPSFSGTSPYFFLHQPHTHVSLYPFLYELTGCLPPHPTSKPINLASQPLPPTPPIPGLSEHRLEACCGEKGPTRHNNMALVL